MPDLRLKRLCVDSDSMIQVEIQVSNDLYKTYQDFYCYPDDLHKFGRDLQKFPFGLKEAVFEYGRKNSDVYCYVLLKAILKDLAGHTAIEIETNNNREGVHRANAHFFIDCEVAQINRIGKSICEWTKDMSSEFAVEWRND